MQSNTAAASAAYGCSAHYLRLQRRLFTVAASATYGCSAYCLRLQRLLHGVAGERSVKSSLTLGSAVEDPTPNPAPDSTRPYP